MTDTELNRFERRKQRTRDRLKQAATELILEQGYDAVTIQEITDRADLGRGTFYVHFKDKEDIVWTILAESVGDLVDRIREYIPNTADDVSQLYFLNLAIFEFADANRDLLRLVLGKQGHALLARRATEYIADVMLRNIPKHVVAKVIHGVPIEFVSHYKAGALMEVITWWLEEEVEYSPEELATMYYRLDVRCAPPTDD
jgi:AcrR family transcriptional regulator